MGTVTDWAHLEQGEHIELARPHQMVLRLYRVNAILS